MATFKIFWKAATREVIVQNNGDASPAGYTDEGTFDWTPPSNVTGYTLDNETVYQFVQAKMYSKGVLDMQSVKIYYRRVRTISLAPPTATIAVNGTQQLTATFVPANAENKEIVWTTSDAAKATVSASGLVTGKASGSATITATTKDGAKTATSVITIS